MNPQLPWSNGQQLFVHIGPHKTGTTYIQQRLVADRELLAARAGVLYPKTGQGFLWGHHELLPVFSEPTEYSRELASLRDELRGYHAGILSSERLCRLGDAGFVNLRNAFAHSEIRILVSLRVRSELLLSYWSESVKHGAEHSLPEFLGRALAEPAANRIVDQKHLLDRAAVIFGKDSLRIFVYRRDADLYPEFLRAVMGGAEILSESMGRWEVVNPSLPIHVTECLRLLTSVARSYGSLDATRIASAFIRAFATPALEGSLAAFQTEFAKRAEVIDLACVDEIFRPLDGDLFHSYRDNIQSSVFGFPESTIGRVLCLPELRTSLPSDLRAILERILRQLISSESFADCDSSSVG